MQSSHLKIIPKTMDISNIPKILASYILQRILLNLKLN